MTIQELDKDINKRCSRFHENLYRDIYEIGRDYGRKEVESLLLKYKAMIEIKLKGMWSES